MNGHNHRKEAAATLTNHDKEKDHIVEILESYGVIACNPETRCIEELRAVLSVFQDDDPV